jgi:hypothetical protein
MRLMPEGKIQPCVVYAFRDYVDEQWKTIDLVVKDKEKFAKMEKVGLTKNKKREWRTEAVRWK